MGKEIRGHHRLHRNPILELPLWEKQLKQAWLKTEAGLKAQSRPGFRG